MDPVVQAAKEHSYTTIPRHGAAQRDRHARAVGLLTFQHATKCPYTTSCLSCLIELPCSYAVPCHKPDSTLGPASTPASLCMLTLGLMLALEGLGAACMISGGARSSKMSTDINVARKSFATLRLMLVTSQPGT
jgi:hypothetical protein